MPENKTIHDLPIAEQVTSSDVFETEIPSQLMQSGFASRKVSLSELEEHILGDEQYSTGLPNFPAGSRTIFGALEYARQSGGGGGASANEALPYDEDSSYIYGDYCIQNNYLWRCISTTTVTGAWDATKWIAVLVTNEYKRVRIMNKADFDLLSADEKDGFIYVSDYPTKIQDVDNVNLTTSDNNKLLGVSVSGSDINVGAVDSLFKVITFNLASCTVPANSNKALLGNDFVDTTDVIPSGYSPMAFVGDYSTNNNIIFNKIECTQAGGTGIFVTLKNITASDATGYVQVKILYIKNSLL